MATLKNLTEANTQTKLTFSQEDFHANRLVWLEAGKAKMMTVTSGKKCLELYAKQNRPLLLAKMLLASSEWLSKMCSLTWKAKVTKSKHLLFQLVPLVQHTEEIEFGLLPTMSVTTTGGVTAMGGGSGNKKKLYRMFGEAGRKIMASGKLNPQFAEALMGYPKGWTQTD